jgi:2-keto-4-pentenoate hydratase/2-oxohepta-3-ene-1,7-dioic acid hydratase in catechol pathway
MHLVTFEHDHTRRAGVLEDGWIIEITGVPGLVEDWLASWPATRERLLEPATRGGAWRLDQVRLEVPLRPRRILATGTNYREHLEEMRATAPGAPSAFLKLPGCELAAGRPLALGAGDDHVDYEGEIALVVGAVVRDATSEQARRAIAGVMLANDISWRDVPMSHTVLGKGRPASCPLGPAVVTTDELDLDNIAFTVHVNDELRQHGRTSSMIHGFEEIVRSYSEALSLQPGDVILTGTTAGVGVGCTPPRFLAPGDSIVVSSPQLGVLRTPVTAA